MNNMIDAKCSGCGSPLVFDPNDKSRMMCSYCGKHFLIDDNTLHVVYDNAEKAGYEFERGRQKAINEQRGNEDSTNSQSTDEIKRQIKEIKIAFQYYQGLQKRWGLMLSNRIDATYDEKNEVKKEMQEANLRHYNLEKQYPQAAKIINEIHEARQKYASKKQEGLNSIDQKYKREIDNIEKEISSLQAQIIESSTPSTFGSFLMFGLPILIGFVMYMFLKWSLLVSIIGVVISFIVVCGLMPKLSEADKTKNASIKSNIQVLRDKEKAMKEKEDLEKDSFVKNYKNGPDKIHPEYWDLVDW